jgi:hypothetical protein
LLIAWKTGARIDGDVTLDHLAQGRLDRGPKAGSFVRGEAHCRRVVGLLHGGREIALHRSRGGELVCARRRRRRGRHRFGDGAGFHGRLPVQSRPFRPPCHGWHGAVESEV